METYEIYNALKAGLAKIESYPHRYLGATAKGHVYELTTPAGKMVVRVGAKGGWTWIY